MRIGQCKTRSQINELKGENYGLQRSQRWKKEVELKKELKGEEHEGLET